MKRLIFLSAGLIILNAPAYALTLSCTLHSEYDRRHFVGRINQSTIDIFSPKKQIHVLNLDDKTAVYKGPEFKTKLGILTNKRIEWEYVVTYNNKEKTNEHVVTHKYMYLRKKKKIIATVDFGTAYMQIVSRRSYCKETQ